MPAYITCTACNKQITNSPVAKAIHKTICNPSKKG